MKYLIAKIQAPVGGCLLENLKNVPDDHQLRFGVSRAAGFPSDANFRMSDDFPKFVALTDALDNRNLLFVASDRLVKCLTTIPGALFQNELLPVKILNHKGRQEKAPYVIVNQLCHPSCLKESDCVGTRFALNAARFQFMDKLVLDEGRIDPNLMLFRAQEYPDFPLVRRDLAECLEAEKFTGISFCEIEGYEF